VVTPYFDECEAWMRQCHQSVAAQAHPCLHVMVADGRPAAFVEDWAIEHVRLPVPHGDFGATPRLVGAYHAIGLGYDAIAFLDADNWYEAGHVERLTQLQMATGAAFLSSGRVLRRLDGSAIGPCPVTDPESFVDTSCMMFAREAFGLLAYWTLMPAYAQVIGDRVMLHHVRASGLKRAHLDAGTVNYRCGKSGIYSQLNEPIPEGVHPPPDYDAAFERWAADGNPSLWPASGCR
jgi:hypothetical protein